MRLNGLTEEIENLVEHLRKREGPAPSLTEVSAVTEILIRTMSGFFRSVDLKIYQECQELSDYISNARKEIAALEPENPDQARIPRAGKELDAIVRATEEATNTIMTAAEEIMSADPEDTVAYQETVNDAVMRIFEACSFQDITGQRISKVVETLTYIEKRTKDLKNLLDIQKSDAAPKSETDISEDRRLLNGPALDGEGIDQSEVDALLVNDAPAAEAPAKAAPKATRTAPATKPAAKPAAKLTAKVAAKPKEAAPPAKLNGKSVGRTAPAPTSVETLELPADTEGRTTQDDIDALFG